MMRAQESLARWRLDAELSARRMGAWVLLAATLTLALCATAAAWSWQRHERLASLEGEVLLLQSRLATAARDPVLAQPPKPSPTQALLTVLPEAEARQVQAQAQAIVALARKAGLSVRQATYAPARGESRGGVASLQITLPMQGSYIAARRWMDELLMALPNVSIDQLEFERESPGAGELDIQVRLSIWQRAAVAPTPKISGRRDGTAS
jgi:hypothetical protein